MFLNVAGSRQKVFISIADLDFSGFMVESIYLKQKYLLNLTIRSPNMFKNDDPFEQNRIKETTVTWTDFGTVLSRFMKVSRSNAKKMNLTLVQAWVLQLIFLRESVSPSELSAYSGTTLPTITGIINGLSNISCVKRERNEKDRRKVIIRLTEKGEDKIRKFQDLQQSFTRKIENGFGKNGMDEFSAVVKLLMVVLSSL